VKEKRFSTKRRKKIFTSGKNERAERAAELGQREGVIEGKNADET